LFPYRIFTRKYLSVAFHGPCIHSWNDLEVDTNWRVNLDEFSEEIKPFLKNLVTFACYFNPWNPLLFIAIWF
jgi:hypothetical protein